MLGQTVAGYLFAVLILAFDERTILSRVNDDLTTQDIFVWHTGGEDTYRQITGRFLTPPTEKSGWLKQKEIKQDINQWTIKTEILYL